MGGARGATQGSVCTSVTEVKKKKKKKRVITVALNKEKAFGFCYIKTDTLSRHRQAPGDSVLLTEPLHRPVIYQVLVSDSVTIVKKTV